MSLTNYVLIVLGALALFAFWLYNSLVRAKTRVEEAWSHIDVQLNRRADLIPNLIETVKGYAKHEKGIFENVTKARSALLGAKTVKESEEADNMLTGALKTIFAVAENYPNLKASDNFKELQDELADTENKIAYARQFYNGNVRDFNILIKSFPNVLLASVLGFKAAEFFEVNQETRKKPEVKF
ncbi:MAG: LemA family protein [candidate division CPR1 bacterium GW2011_GWC1_49_13]|uniref:LemA family protein n=1 Tax=candidate division CPR1 bacterium GW2011_GWC1_49_13 TaxID=1618342 RepID=A0A0G1XS05_9BACT|nr:MAG: LemA family protein [candidate division CPR1 bacterium GW2011_GWC1_49_13]